METSGTDSIHNSEQAPTDGLTKREYFAAMAMQGIMANQNSGSIPKMCQDAVFAADELIKALNQPHENKQP